MTQSNQSPPGFIRNGGVFRPQPTYGKASQAPIGRAVGNGVFSGQNAWYAGWKPDTFTDGNPMNAMKPEDPDMSALAKEVAKAEAKLQELEWEIEEVGQPAAHELQRRLDALKVEEKALKRNLAELLGTDHPDDDKRLHKIESLLDYIRREEASLKDDADFLHQSGPTTAEFAVKAGSLVVDLVLRALKRVLGDHHPLGLSVFVNHTHKDLVDRYGISQQGECEESR